jgi:hypothetical protein
MAIANIPLNHFSRNVYEITTVPTLLYTAPFDRASIILAAYATNTTENDINITIGLSGVGAEFIPIRPYYDYAKNILVSGKDTTNMTPAKLVLEEFDALIVSASAPGIVLNVSILETINIVE